MASGAGAGMMAAMTDFALHAQLQRDTIEVVRWGLSLVLLMNARQWPWLILVPRQPNRRELHDLAPADRAVLIEEVARAGAGLDRLFRPAKINVGALGNLVPQLHVHVIARFADDPAWPRPVWGTVTPEPYEAAELSSRLELLRLRL